MTGRSCLAHVHDRAKSGSFRLRFPNNWPFVTKRCRLREPAGSVRTEPTWERNRLATCVLHQSPAFRSDLRFGTARRHRSLRKRERHRRPDRIRSTGQIRRSLIPTKPVGSTRSCQTSKRYCPTSALNSREPNMPMSSSGVQRKSEPNTRTTDPSNSVPHNSTGTSADVGNRHWLRNPANSNSPRPSARPLALQTSSSHGSSHGHRSNTHQRSVGSRLLRVAALATAILGGSRELVTSGHRICRS